MTGEFPGKTPLITGVRHRIGHVVSLAPAQTGGSVLIPIASQNSAVAKLRASRVTIGVAACVAALAVFSLLRLTADQARAEAAASNRYPTADEVYYVLACMQMNGQDASGLRKCSCAVNALEAHLSYDKYRDAQLVVALRQAGGRNAAIYRDTAPMKAILTDFTRAQADANRECFGATSSANGGAQR